jgi:Zn finger protein HypA/HybF involved in hydrogenase expression
MQREQRQEPMNTQILQRPVYSNEHHMATLRCPQCGRTKSVEVAQYQDAPRPPKVKCPCGHRFRVPIATSLSSRYRCPQCEGKGYRFIAQGKKVSVSSEGYVYHTLHSHESCTMCGGLGAYYPVATRGGISAVLLTALAYFADATLSGLDWCARQVGADGSSLRTWLEMDICALGKR